MCSKRLIAGHKDFMIKCTKRIKIASLSREIGWLEEYAISMSSKHRKISLTSKVYYFMVPPYSPMSVPPYVKFLECSTMVSFSFLALIFF